MHILFLSQQYPYPASTMSAKRNYNLLRGLAREHDVTLMTFGDAAQQAIKRGPLRTICEKVYVFEQKRKLGARARALVGGFSAEFADSLKAILDAKKIDLIIASQLNTAQYASYFGDTPAIFEQCTFARDYKNYMQAETWRGKLQRDIRWSRHKAYMRTLMTHFDYCTVATEAERQIVAALIPRSGKVVVVPTSLALGDYVSPSVVKKRLKTLVFAGSLTNPINHEAMHWFLQDVYPQIREQHVDVTVRIVGEHADLPLPLATNIIRTGFLDNAQLEIAQATVAIVPLLQTDTPHRILEPMTLNTPVISTSKGAEGVDCVHSKHVLLGDTPAEFAAAVIRLLDDEALRADLTTNAVQLVAQKYNWERVLPHYALLVKRAANLAPPVELHAPFLDTISDI